MWKEKTGGYAIVEYRHLLFMRAAIAFLVLFLALQLFRSYTADFAAKSEAAPVQAEAAPVQEAPVPDGMKTAVLDWMKKNSDMPDVILSRVYDEASALPNSDLLLAVCKVESSFNPNIRSDRNALGLMGVRPSVWLGELKERGILQSRRDLYLIHSNIAAGAYVLQKYLLRRGKLEEALNDYVGGDSEYTGRIVQALGEIYAARVLYAESHSSAMAKADEVKGATPAPKG